MIPAWFTALVALSAAWSCLMAALAHKALRPWYGVATLACALVGMLYLFVEADLMSIGPEGNIWLRGGFLTLLTIVGASPWVHGARLK